MQELTQSGGLSHTNGDSTILDIGAGVGDNSLPLGRPGDQVVPEEHGIARCGATSVRAVKIISPTYSKRYTVSEPRRKMNNKVSELASMNPNVVR
jgi:hypothetical protein